MPKDKRPPKLPAKEFPFPDVPKPEEVQQVSNVPQYDKKDLLKNRFEDAPVNRGIKVLPPEILQELKKYASESNNQIALVYRYLEKLLKDGIEFEEALKKTYENVYPL